MHRQVVRTPLLAAVLAAALSALPAVVAAHADLVASSPDAGANLDTPPTQVTLTFDDELDPAASGFSVLDHHGDEVGSGEVDLNVADRNVMAGNVAISDPGVYTVEWSVTGVDGHAVSGSFWFGYATDEEIPEGEGGHHENPDTAMPTTAPSPPVVAGALLIGLAVLTATRRKAVR